MGNIPFISSGVGVNFSEFRGLIPGTISNLNAFNPAGLFQAFLEGSIPSCQKIKMEIIDTENHISTESQYVTTVDVRNMDPCVFKDKKNPVTKQKCKETFENSEDESSEAFNYNFSLPNDPIVQLFFSSFGIFGIYLFYEILSKNKMIPKIKL